MFVTFSITNMVPMYFYYIAAFTCFHLLQMLETLKFRIFWGGRGMSTQSKRPPIPRPCSDIIEGVFYLVVLVCSLPPTDGSPASGTNYQPPKRKNRADKGGRATQLPFDFFHISSSDAVQLSYTTLS